MHIPSYFIFLLTDGFHAECGRGGAGDALTDEGCCAAAGVGTSAAASVRALVTLKGGGNWREQILCKFNLL
jgi:hypothetical protein